MTHTKQVHLRCYILVVTTFHPNMRGSFTILVSGPHNLTLNRINKKHSSCVIGDQCSLFTKGIGLTINDILRNKIQSNIPFGKQSALIQTAAGHTMIMFVIGFINGIFSLITFRNKEKTLFIFRWLVKYLCCYRTNCERIKRS